MTSRDRAAHARPRLLVLSSTYPRWAGDPEPGFVHELARRLTDRFEVVVLCPHAPGAQEEEELQGVRVVRYRYAPLALEVLVNDGGILANLRRRRWAALLLPGFVLGLAWRQWRLQREWRPDVVHAHWLIPQGLLATALQLFAKPRVPVLVTSHGVDLFALRGKWFAAAKRYVLRRASAVTVVSTAMLGEVAALGGDPERARVMPMGIDMDGRFTRDPAVVRSRNELLFVGRLVAKKGLSHLIDAMPRVLQSRPNTTLTVIGFGPEEARLREQVDELGLASAVTFHGPVAQSELPRHYQRTAVMVAPFVRASNGDQEGLGLVTLEALACGCPVVVGDVPAVADLGLNGVDARDAGALADAVLRALDGKAEAMDSGAVEQRLQAFSWPRVVDGYAALLCDILNRGAKITRPCPP